MRKPASAGFFGSSHSFGDLQLDTGLASLCALLRYLYPDKDHWRVDLSSWFRPSRASHFLLLAQEKVTKEKGTPPSGPGCAGVPSLHHHSRGTLRRAIHGPSQLSRHPCRSTPYVAIPLGLLKGTWPSSVPSQLKSKGQTPPISTPQRLRKLATWSPSGGRAEVLRRGVSRMDAAKGLKGHGWPL